MRKVYRPEFKDGGYTYQKGKGILQYPFAIEIVSIPYKTSILNDLDRSGKFIGAVNYSISPRSNAFDGDYRWDDKKLHYDSNADSMKSILQTHGFAFRDYSDSKIKIPSIILVNLISPRVDYHGHDKSRIDTQSFTQTIIAAAQKIAKDTRTFRGAGFIFTSEKQHDMAPLEKANRVTVKDVLNKFLDRIRTGSSLNVNV